ncbi:MAG: hypothetical protein B6D39_10370 [Anaerolineae bacterium UTCFX2]|nr:lipoyl(octanoyl) transferase [Anaerolineales bacterium]OQY89112.1 MAG: hypothetical protein B6D39_10370 [Anaerolineae bacterium UTCFX2]
MVSRLGIVPYRPAWELQERLAKLIGAGQRSPALLLLQHPHIYTFGRRGQIENLLWGAEALQREGVELLWVDRGGDVTYHGPGQVVGYPLLPLGPVRAGTIQDETTSTAAGLPRADYIGYLRRLEETLIRALDRLGVPAARLNGKSGVWVSIGSDPQPAKIAAIGVKVDARGVTRHGFALNVDPEMRFWDGIVACGLKGYPAASLAEILDPVPALAQVEEAILAAFAEVFSYRLVEEKLSPAWLEGAQYEN